MIRLNGWKTYIGGWGLIVAAFGGLILHYTRGPDSAMALDPNSAVEQIFLGISIIGARHFVQRELVA